MNIVFALKLTLVPLLILGISLVQRRWGPAVAGWLSAFPVISAPILLFISLDQGTQFAARAAAGTLSAVLAILAFGLGYAWAATRWVWGISLTCGLIGYSASVAGLSFASLPAAVAAPLVFLALALARGWFPEPPRVTQTASASNDIAWRMVAGALAVVAVTHFSARLGPQLSGLLAMLPILSSVLAVFSHRNTGAGAAITLLRGSVVGYFGFATFCLVLSLCLPALGVGGAFALALGCAAGVHALARLHLLRAERAAAALP